VSRLVFITGASSGIGQALALRFFQAGYRLALVARRTSEVQAWASANSIGADSYRTYSADVSDADSIVAAGRDCIAAQGVPDVVIANAGISIGMDTAIREDLDVMRQTFATNNIGVAGIRGLPGHGAYCASKAAVIAYCESLRGELKSAGVHVVTICPGYIDTPLTKQNSYSMPFLMKPEHFADKAFSAIQAGSSYSVIPWQMGVVAKLLRLLPNAVFDKVLSGRARKKRQGT
jgi:short-subunit dehydrogenase